MEAYDEGSAEMIQVFPSDYGGTFSSLNFDVSEITVAVSDPIADNAEFSLQVDGGGDGTMEYEIIPGSCCMPNSWEYVFEDVELGTTLKISIEDQCFQFMTPNKDYVIREATYMKVYDSRINIRHEDGELRLITLSIDAKLDFCVTIIWNVQEHKRYFLIENVGKE